MDGTGKDDASVAAPADGAAVDLAEWLQRIGAAHPAAVELGLDRVGAVWQALGAPRPAPTVVTVGGTNGKGSTVAFLVAILRAAGYRVGAYTSPHLLAYNERVAIDGVAVDDAALCRGFSAVEQARGTTSLTYFEHGTLAALTLFAASRLDVCILEVGLGGRLDAVNLIDADAAIVTTVDLDHQDWLGPDREAIGHEKAGIFRRGRPAVVGEVDPPAALLAAARKCGARLLRRGHEFEVERGGEGAWRMRLADGTVLELPAPQLAAPSQVDNAAAAIAAVLALGERLAVPPAALANGIRAAQVPARLQRIGTAPEIVVDVGHNPQAARELARWLAGQPRRPTWAVFAALADKDLAGVVAPLAGLVERWYIGSLRQDTPRGLAAEDLIARLAGVLAGADCRAFGSVSAALAAARGDAAAEQRILVFGSFFTAAAALRAS